MSTQKICPKLQPNWAWGDALATASGHGHGPWHHSWNLDPVVRTITSTPLETGWSSATCTRIVSTQD